jgi:hypothetical protein
MRFRVMRFHAMRFRVMRFRASPAAPSSGVVTGSDVPAVPALPSPRASGEWGTGHPVAESQRAGIDHLIQIAMEQAAARRGSPTGRAGTGPADGAGRPGPGAGLPGDGTLPGDDTQPGDDRGETPEAYRYI